MKNQDSMTGQEQKIKISELPVSVTFTGLWTIGYQEGQDGRNTSVRVSLDEIQSAYDNVIEATSLAREASVKANISASLADLATEAANTAAGKANAEAESAKNAGLNAVAAADEANRSATLAENSAKKAGEATDMAEEQANRASAAAASALSTIADMDALGKAIASYVYAAPVSMRVTVPESISLKNKVKQRISVSLSPSYVMKNVLYQRVSGDSTVSDPSGELTLSGVGETVFHIIPTQNTELWREVRVRSRNPLMRLATSGKIRINGKKIRIV